MTDRRLEFADKQVSAICLVCATFGSQLSEAESFALLDRYLELGGNALDTAHVYGAWDPSGANGGYGNSEVVIGRWLRSRGDRGRVVLGTKGGHPDSATGESRLTREALRRQLEESMERLATDYVDLYWLHRDDRAIPVAEILGWLADSVSSGAIRALGCSH